jgi:hypothetical protein
MTFKKSLISIAAAAILATGFTGCGSSNNGTAAVDPLVTVNGELATAAAALETAGTPVKYKTGSESTTTTTTTTTVKPATEDINGNPKTPNIDGVTATVADNTNTMTVAVDGETIALIQYRATDTAEISTADAAATAIEIDATKSYIVSVTTDAGDRLFAVSFAQSTDTVETPTYEAATAAQLELDDLLGKATDDDNNDDLDALVVAEYAMVIAGNAPSDATDAAAYYAELLNTLVDNNADYTRAATVDQIVATIVKYAASTTDATALGTAIKSYLDAINAITSADDFAASKATAKTAYDSAVSSAKTPATDTGTDDPATDDPATDDPATDDPATDDPATDDPATDDGGATELTVSPATTDLSDAPAVPSNEGVSASLSGTTVTLAVEGTTIVMVQYQEDGGATQTAMSGELTVKSGSTYKVNIITGAGTNLAEFSVP